MMSMRKSLSHMLHRGLSRGWGAWLEMAAERREFLQLLRKGVSFMVNREVAMAFAAWRPSRCADPRARALSYFMNREQTRAWVKWHSDWADARVKLLAMRKSLSHMLHLSLKHI